MTQKNSPLVSVIVPCYNQAPYLAQALESVLAQTFSLWECIVVDDGSTDNTREIAEAFCKMDERISYCFKTNQGVSAARNAGINLAAGKYILPLDGDDYIGAEYLQKAVAEFVLQPDLSLVYCQANKFGEENEWWNLAEYSYQKLLLLNMIFCTALFKKADWVTAGGYDEAMHVGWEDWAFWVKLLNSQSKVIRLNEVLFFYRIKIKSRNTGISPQNNDGIKWWIFKQNLEKYEAEKFSPILAYNKIAELEQRLQMFYQSNSYRIGNKIVRIGFRLNLISLIKKLQVKKQNSTNK